MEATLSVSSNPIPQDTESQAKVERLMQELQKEQCALKAEVHALRNDLDERAEIGSSPAGSAGQATGAQTQGQSPFTLRFSGGSNRPSTSGGSNGWSSLDNGVTRAEPQRLGCTRLLEQLGMAQVRRKTAERTAEKMAAELDEVKTSESM